MRTRKTILAAIVTMNVESADTIHALQFLEAVQGYLGCARDELKKLCEFLLVEGPDSAPEPLDLRGAGRVVVVLGVRLPVVDVDIRQTRNEKFELLFVEDGDELFRDDLVEACCSFVNHGTTTCHFKESTYQ